MILTSHSISSVSNTIDYCLQPIKIAEVIHSDGLDLTGISFDNSSAHNTEAIKQDFLLYQNERLSKPYLSLILSPEIDLDNKALKEIIDDLLKEMKLDNRQMIAITHTEHRAWEQNSNESKPIKHVHILLNRVDYNQNTYNDKFIGLKGIQAASKVANNHKLRDVYNTRDYERKAVKKTNSNYHSDKNATAMKLQNIVKPILYSRSNLTVDDVFQELISEHQVDIELTKFKNGSYGVQLKYENQTFKASEISRMLTVVPEGDSYKANKQLQQILDKNSMSSGNETPKTEKEIREDYNIHQDSSIYFSQLADLNAQLKMKLSMPASSSSQSERSKDDDDDQPIIHQTKRRRPPGPQHIR